MRGDRYGRVEIRKSEDVSYVNKLMWVCICVYWYVCIYGIGSHSNVSVSVHEISTRGVKILPMKACRRCRGEVHIQDLGLRWTWVISFTPRRLYFLLTLNDAGWTPQCFNPLKHNGNFLPHAVTLKNSASLRPTHRMHLYDPYGSQNKHQYCLLFVMETLHFLWGRNEPLSVI
jgi:hypothetical protein